MNLRRWVNMRVAWAKFKAGQHVPFEHQQATNFIDRTAVIGRNTSVWHWAVILADVVIGHHCSIGSFVEIGRGSVIGDWTRISNGVFLPSNSIIGKCVFLGPGVTCTDDRHPRANNAAYDAEPPIIEDGASVGARAVILPGIRVGRGAMVGAGAIVTHDVEPGSMVRGEPARKRDWSRGVGCMAGESIG